jgi:hypothetical protein
VLWLSTETARQGDWARASSAVLEGRGFRCECIPVHEQTEVFAPGKLCQKLVGLARNRPASQAVFVLNGGQKHSVLGMDRAAQNLGAQLIYSDLKPVQLRILEPNGDCFQAKPLANPLSLRDYLTSRGMQFEESSQSTDCADFARFRHPVEFRFQLQKLQENEQRGAKTTFGRWFEAAVAARVHQFLDAHPEFRLAVLEVGHGVSVTRNQSIFAEYDVLLLLANATVIHIECKTGKLDKNDKNDNYARVAKLRMIGGDGTTQVICAPFFADSRFGRGKLKSFHSRRHRVEEWNVEFLPYTADGQPLEYSFDGRTERALPFEQKLQQILMPYLPSQPEAAQSLRS